jgi:hypothetical protein
MLAGELKLNARDKEDSPFLSIFLQAAAESDHVVVGDGQGAIAEPARALDELLGGETDIVFGVVGGVGVKIDLQVSGRSILFVYRNLALSLIFLRPL